MIKNKLNKIIDFLDEHFFIIMVIFILCVTVLLASAGIVSAIMEAQNDSQPQPQRISNSSIRIYVDTETNVEYLTYGNHIYGGITQRLNANGSIIIHNYTSS